MPVSDKAVFTLVAIKPTHHDDDGDPIQWLRADISPTTFPALDCRERPSRARDGIAAASALVYLTGRARV